jgi:hypothetical protein
MLTKRLPSILSPLNLHEILKITKSILSQERPKFPTIKFCYASLDKHPGEGIFQILKKTSKPHILPKPSITPTPMFSGIMQIISKKRFHKSLKPIFTNCKKLKKTCYEKETTPFGCSVFVGRYNGSVVL